MGDAQRLRPEIRRVLDSIERDRDRADRLTEADTKAAFIEPILSALGWELRDISDVSREYRHRPQDNPVDYALFIMRSPVLFVEAKSLTRDLSDYKWVSQTIAYANAAGVEWCVLTNGDEYRIYNAFAKAEADKKIFRSFRLSDRDTLDFAVETLLLLSKETMAEKRINLLWKLQFVDQQVRNAIHGLFDEPSGGLVRLIGKHTGDLRPAEIRESLRRMELSLRFPRSTKGSIEVPSGGIVPPEGIGGAGERADGPDFTRYDVTFDSETTQGMWKRNAIDLIFKRLCGNGVDPNEMDELFGRKNPWCSVDGVVDAPEFVKRMSKQDPSFEKGQRRWFCRDDELVHVNGRTYALSKQWGGPHWHQAMARLREKYRGFGIEFVPTGQQTK